MQLTAALVSKSSYIASIAFTFARRRWRSTPKKWPQKPLGCRKFSPAPVAGWQAGRVASRRRRPVLKPLGPRRDEHCNRPKKQGRTPDGCIRGSNWLCRIGSQHFRLDYFEKVRTFTTGFCIRVERTRLQVKEAALSHRTEAEFLHVPGGQSVESSTGCCCECLIIEYF